eukprot:5983228-Alexandrium_andersonii.AAC.1
MSASLVGSEMCIRDSLLGMKKEDPHSPGIGLPGYGDKSGPVPQRPDPGSCLLYTSDAADDM